MNSAQQQTVALIVDPEFGDRLVPLASRMPVWVVETPANRDAVLRLRSQKHDMDPAKPVITTFKVPAGISVEEACLGVLADIELHHGEYSQKPPYFVLEVFGVEATQRIQAALRDLAFFRFIAGRNDGFTAKKQDPRSTDDLIRLALSEKDEEEAWGHVTTLHWRGTEEVYQKAAGLCQSPKPEERALGVNILSQLGVTDRLHPVQTAELLLTMLGKEAEAEVLQSIAVAFSHIDLAGNGSLMAKVCDGLSALKQHTDPDVRHGVALGLAGCTHPVAINTLIALMEDPDRDVRDWATFAMGTQTDEDSEAIRAALKRNLGDPDHEIRGEALVGLAKRGDRDILKYILDEFYADEVGVLLFDAIQEIKERPPQIYEKLLLLKETADRDPEAKINEPDGSPGYWYRRLTETIDLCRPKESNQTTAESGT
jgi:HEAT repeat protein